MRRKGRGVTIDEVRDNTGFDLLVPDKIERTLAPDAEELFVLRRAVDTALFHPDRRSDTLRRSWGVEDGDLAVVHVGRLAAEKNLDLAIRAFEVIRAQHPRARLVMVGDGPLREALAAQHPHVVFAGMRHGEDLASHYASGDLFLFPSLTETFGNVTLEALACGVPVVAFDYAAAREHLHDLHAGTRVARGDEDAFVAAALDWSHRLAAGEGEGERSRHAAREAVAGLSTAQVSAQFAQLLGSLRQRSAA